MKKALVVFPFLFLAACSSKSHPDQTKDWYLQHDAERATRVKECKNDAAQQATADCQNAIAADDQAYALGK